jgi:hypothetical protein
MKHLIFSLVISSLIIFSACTDKNEQIVKDIDSQVDSIMNKLKDLEQKSFQDPKSSEAITGYFGEDGKAVMVKFDSYPDFVQYFSNKEIICIIHNIVGEGGVSSSESKYYYKDGKLFYYTNNKEVREITADVEKASKELLDIESEYIKTLENKGKVEGQTSSTTGGLSFLNDFVDKPSYDVAEDERLTSRLKAIVKGSEDYSQLISELAYGDAIQKFNDVIVINGELRQTIDEQGTQVTFLSIIVADLAKDVLSVGMTDEKGNTSIFYTEAPGEKYPKQLVDWFTQDYRNVFKMEAQ